MTVYGYARVSTLTQAREGESLEAQERQMLAYAFSKGLEVSDADIFVEAGVGGGIAEMRALRGNGKSYRGIEKWLSEKERINISVKGVRHILNEAR